MAVSVVQGGYRVTPTRCWARRLDPVPVGDLVVIFTRASDSCPPGFTRGDDYVNDEDSGRLWTFFWKVWAAGDTIPPPPGYQSAIYHIAGAAPLNLDGREDSRGGGSERG